MVKIGAFSAEQNYSVHSNLKWLSIINQSRYSICKNNQYI